MSLHAAVMRVEFLIPDAQSLKEKRRVLKPLLNALTRKYPVASAEVEFQNTWQRVALGVGFVASNAGQLERLVDAVRSFLDQHVEIEVTDVRLSYLEDPRE